MKKGKITVMITIAIACFVLTMVMCMQFKIVKQTDITSIETMREEELRSELANWKKMYKKAEVIVITINDLNSEDLQPISSYYLLIIVDYLRLAGAEAISINGERIINMSDIAYIGNSIIFVNQQRILAPYIIQAIGDPTKLESTLLGNGGYVEELKNIGFDINIERENKINIKKYSKDIGYKYIQ